MSAAAFASAWPSSDEYAARMRGRSLALIACAMAIALVYAGLLVTSGGSLLLLAPLAATLVAAAIVRRPVVGLYLLAAAAVLLEQFDLPKNTPLTAQTHIYQNLSSFTSIPLRLSVMDLLVVLTLASWAGWRIAKRERIDVGPYAGAVALYVGAFGLGTVIGIARGPAWDSGAALNELRGPVYLGVLYVLAADLVRERRQIAVIVWTFLVLVTVKAIQGITTYLASPGRYDEVTGHEDVIFFNAAIALVIVAVVLGLRTRITVALVGITPALLLAELFTQRRQGFVAFGLLAAAITLLFLLHRPRRGIVLAAVGVLAIAAYLPLFWDDNGPIGQPIRAVRAATGDRDVSVRDQLSDRWRVVENSNIAFTMRQVPLTGVGVGQMYFLRQEPPRLPASFTYWQYETHNALLWLWLKAGPLGALALWYLVARVVTTGAAIWTRLGSDELRLLATLPIAFLLGQIVFSAVELGLTYSRTMVMLGVALGTGAYFARALRAPSAARVAG